MQIIRSMRQLRAWCYSSDVMERGSLVRPAVRQGASRISLLVGAALGACLGCGGTRDVPLDLTVATGKKIAAGIFVEGVTTDGYVVYYTLPRQGRDWRAPMADAVQLGETLSRHERMGHEVGGM